MTLYVRMRIPRFSLAHEVLKSKINIATTLLSYLSGVFIPYEIELWHNAPAESLEGKLIKSIEIKPDTSPTAVSMLIDRMLKSPLVVPIKTVVVFEGVLRVKEKDTIKDIPAYMTVYNNPEWREVYHDIEFDVYPTKTWENVNNLSDIYIINPDLRDRLNSVIGRFMSLARGKIEKIVIGDSPDAVRIITERVETTNPSGPSFIVDIIRTIRYEADEMGYDYARKISLSIKPYKEVLVASRLWGLKEFKPFFESIMKISDIHMYESSSGLMLFTVRKEGFKKLYEIMVEKFFDPFAAHLIDVDTLVKMMRGIITGTKTLDEYSKNVFERKL